MKFGSLFAGAGGFDLGFEGAGFECCWQVEWDKFCQDVLSFRWPDVPKFGDIREVSGYELEPVDVITYGFPCQDLSLAGDRAGLDGSRSGLFFEAMRVIKEMRDATGGRFPRVAVAENVLGLLSADSGYAMGRCLDEMAEAGAVGVEWCTLDAQRFGVAQKRKRVFVASIFDSGVSGRCSDGLFLFEEDGGGCVAESEESGCEVAGEVVGGVGKHFEVLGFDSKFSGHYGADSFADGVSATLKTNQAPAVAVLHKDGVPFNESSFGGFSEGFGCLASSDFKRPYRHVVGYDDMIRRLTPRECERLMGWPDDHTKFGVSGREMSKTQRYKMCGNGVVAPVARWVAEQIVRVL